MKKLILLLLCTATLGLVSCKKDPIPYNNPNRTYNFTIKPGEWKISQDKRTYSFDWPSNAIQPINVDDDGILVYMSHPLSTNSYIPVPFTFDAASYSYELYDGGLSIDLQSADRNDLAPAPPTGVVLVKVVIIESLYGGE